MESKKQQGFSLIELMIALAVVGIIAGIAYPSYIDSIRKSRRSEAKGALVELSQFMARTYAENKTYQPGGASPTITPPNDISEHYNFTFTTITDDTFTLNAAPLAGQADDRCGTLTVNELSQENITGAATGVTASDCW